MVIFAENIGSENHALAGLWFFQKQKNQSHHGTYYVPQKKEPEETDVIEPEDEVITTFKTVHVFDISQTDGKPLPEFARVGGDPGLYTERLRKYVASRGIRIEYCDTIGQAEGVSSGGLIRLKKGLAPGEEMSVLAHELAHEILHNNEDHTPKGRKVREAEAEAVAFVLCNGIGLDVNSASSDYIQLYDGEKKTLLQSLGRIQRTAAEILEAIMATDESKRATADVESCLAVAA